MAETPRFSVTIPAYNAEATLEETVSSVTAQTFTDFEIVICNDGSTDSTLALAQRLAGEDRRIRVVTQENRGSGGAYNTAVRAARSDLLVMLSADDLLLPEHLGEYDRFISANPECGIYSSDVFIEYDDGFREVLGMHETWADPSTCAMADLLRACFLGVGAVYRRAMFDAVGGFREDIYAEDYLFWMLGEAHGFGHCYLNKVLSVHRRNMVQKSAAAMRMRQADVFAIEQVIATGLLSPEMKRAAEHSIARHKRNIQVRKVLGATLGEERASRLINRLRHRRAVPTSKQAD